MKEYYIWDSPCDEDALTEEECIETQQLEKLDLSPEEIKWIMNSRKIRRAWANRTAQREQTIVIASHINEAIETLKKNTLSWKSLIFVGTQPLTTENIDCLDFVEYAPCTASRHIEDGTKNGKWETYPVSPQSPIMEWGCPHVVIRRIRDCPLGAPQ